jgi:hypothetical protein
MFRQRAVNVQKKEKEKGNEIEKSDDHGVLA